MTYFVRSSTWLPSVAGLASDFSVWPEKSPCCSCAPAPAALERPCTSRQFLRIHALTALVNPFTSGHPGTSALTGSLATVHFSGPSRQGVHALARLACASCSVTH